jgi:hypothetical protein
VRALDIIINPICVGDDYHVGEYDMILDGEVIVSRSRDPEHDAARVLKERGITGTFRTVDAKTGKHRMTVDIEQAAKLVAIEEVGGGIRLVPLDGGPATYESAAEQAKDKERLSAFLDALDGVKVAFRLDESRLWTIRGDHGYISTYGDGTSFLLYVRCRSIRHWNSTKKRLAFCTVTQDGDEEGCLQMDHLPSPDEAEIIRDVLGIWRRREMTEAALERLAKARNMVGRAAGEGAQAEISPSNDVQAPEGQNGPSTQS